MKFYKYLKKNYIISLFIVMIILIATIFSINSIKMYHDTTQRTQNYLKDVTRQTTSKVDELIKHSIYTLNYIKDGLDAIDITVRNNYLLNIQQNTIFSSLKEFESNQLASSWILETYGQGYSIDTELLNKGNTQLIAIVDKDCVLYVLSKGHERILIGTYENDSLKELLNDQSFNNLGQSFPILSSGTIITENSNANFFDQLQSDYKIDLETLNTIKQDIRNNKSNYIYLKSKTNEDYLLNYEPLNYADWEMITLVPSSALGISVESYAFNNIILTLLAIVIIALLITLVIRSQKKYTHFIEKHAFKDNITGGMNRNFFIMELERKLPKSKYNEYSIASIDIQDFKVINNAFGVKQGDQTLKYIYEKINENLKDNELAVRDSADIFIVLLHENDKNVIKQRFKDLYTSIHNYPKTTQENYVINIRCGVMDLASCSIEEAIQCANTARKNKVITQKTFISFYEQDILNTYLKEKELLSSLDTAIENKEFEVYLQPKVDIHNSKIIGAEALVRWNHPKYGLLMPQEFISVFEDNHEIQKIDYYVFKEVCRLLNKWKTEGRDLIKISVNLSKHNLTNSYFLDKYYAITQQYNVPPQYIEFELTETVFMENVSQMCIYIERMHNYGFTCSLDDFGTGYSSLSLLKDLNIDVLKLDRSFFLGENSTEKGLRVVEAIITIAGKFHMQTVAEGIDEQTQLTRLKQIGCDMVQGYIYYKPLPIAEFEKALEQKTTNITMTLPLPFEHDIESYENIIIMHYHLSNDKIHFTQTSSKQYELPDDMLYNDFINQNTFIHPHDKMDFTMMIERAKNCSYWLKNEIRIKMGKDRYGWIDVYVYYDKSYNMIYSLFINYTCIKQSILTWKDKAYHDSLTKLYNREYLEKSLLNEMDKNTVKNGAVIFIDIDDFKQVNDQYGHSVGDDLLYYASMRMRKIFRKQDIIARYGGDEFVIFTPGITQETLKTRLETIMTTFLTPYKEGNIAINISCSIGAIYFDDYICDYEHLLNLADQAMYIAKNNGKNQYHIITTSK